MARKQAQIIARGQSSGLVRIYQGRDPQTGTRKYLNQTIHGPLREAQLLTRSFYDYQTLLRLYIRPILGTRLIGAIGQIKMRELYAQMFEPGLSARSIEYTNAVLESAFRQAVRWRMLAEDPALASICRG